MEKSKIDLPFEILFEDNHLLALVKPPEMLTQPASLEERRDDISLEEHGKAFLKEKYQKKGNVFLEPIFRLDRAASGIVLFAKTSKALSRLKEKGREQAFIKKYLTIVSPSPKEEKGNCHNFLVHGSHKALCFPLTKKPLEGKESLLFYEKQGESAKTALLKIDLKTGRYHQIRAQLSFLGCPILGDLKYGGVPHRKQGIFLHHFSFSFPHPITGEVIHLKHLPLNDPLWEELYPSLALFS